jgi:IclR family transcriptional regulator, acetate operon repressor
LGSLADLSTAIYQEAEMNQTVRTRGGQDLVKAASPTLDLFEAFAEAGGPLSLTEISQRISVPISSCHSLIRTLQMRGYVYVLEERKRIYPTKRLLGIAQAIGRYDPVLERLSPVMNNLARKTGETVIVGKMQGEIVIYLGVVPGSHTIRYTASPGDTFPTHSSALGKSTLSLLDDEALDKAISKLKLTQLTDATITDAKTFKKDIVVGRQRGYFLTRGETVTDVMGISIARRIGGSPMQSELPDRALGSKKTLTSTWRPSRRERSRFRDWTDTNR